MTTGAHVRRMKMIFDSADYLVFRLTTLSLAVYGLWRLFR
jgi:hypothetical protein